MELEPDVLVVRSRDVLDAAVGGETVLLELGADRYYRLKGTGAWLWQTLDRPRSPRALAALLSAEHRIDDERALADVEAFLRSLADRGLIEPAPGA